MPFARPLLVPALAALALLLPHPLFAEDTPPAPKPAPVSEAVKAVAKQRLILEVEFVAHDMKGYSGMTGSTFSLRVKQVVRMEKGPAHKTDAYLRRVHAALSAKDLKTHDALEWSLLYGAKDKAMAALDKKLHAKLKAAAKGGSFFLACPTTAWLHDGGTITPRRWGKLNATDALFLPADLETRAALTKQLADPARVPPYKPAPVPAPALEPGPQAPARR